MDIDRDKFDLFGANNARHADHESCNFDCVLSLTLDMNSDFDIPPCFVLSSDLDNVDTFLEPITLDKNEKVNTDISKSHIFDNAHPSIINSTKQSNFGSCERSLHKAPRDFDSTFEDYDSVKACNMNVTPNFDSISYLEMSSSLDNNAFDPHDTDLHKSDLRCFQNEFDTIQEKTDEKKPDSVLSTYLNHLDMTKDFDLPPSLSMSSNLDDVETFFDFQLLNVNNKVKSKVIECDNFENGPTFISNVEQNIGFQDHDYSGVRSKFSATYEEVKDCESVLSLNSDTSSNLDMPPYLSTSSDFDYVDTLLNALVSDGDSEDKSTASESIIFGDMINANNSQQENSCLLKHGLCGVKNASYTNYEELESKEYDNTMSFDSDITFQYETSSHVNVSLDLNDVDTSLDILIFDMDNENNTNVNESDILQNLTTPISNSQKQILFRNCDEHCLISEATTTISSLDSPMYIESADWTKENLKHNMSSIAQDPLEAFVLKDSSIYLSSASQIMDYDSLITKTSSEIPGDDQGSSLMIDDQTKTKQEQNIQDEIQSLSKSNEDMSLTGQNEEGK